MSRRLAAAATLTASVSGGRRGAGRRRGRARPQDQPAGAADHHRQLPARGREDEGARRARLGDAQALPVLLLQTVHLAGPERRRRSLAARVLRQRGPGGG